MSAFTTIVGRLGELSESELRQLHLIVGVRLGKPEGGKPNQRSAGGTSNKGSKGKAQGAKPPGKDKKSASKGNPSRKSQWETHPLYREYKRLKKVVETQAKESKTAFAAVDTPERAAYNEALSQWLEAKSSFRDRSGPEKETEEATSSKGKGKASGVAGDPSSMRIPHGSSWADAVQEDQEMASAGDSDEESADEDVDRDLPEVSKVSKRGTRAARLPSRSTPPKKSSEGSSKK